MLSRGREDPDPGNAPEGGAVARVLRQVGLLLFAVAACMAVASSAAWVEPARIDPWIVPALQVGAVSFAFGLVLPLAGAVARMVRRGHCVRCGRVIERGQTYCIDHLRETVAEYQEHQRDRPGRRS
jgi:predicted nucleic acid-binding Zn ribbon protein